MIIKKYESAEKKKEAPKKYESKKDTSKQENESTEQTEQSTVQSTQPVEQPQEVENPARDQVISEGIDMDNPTDAETEHMRESAKDSSHVLQSAPSQGGN